MAHTRPITNDFWYDEAPGDEGPFPGYHEVDAPDPGQASGVFDWIGDLIEDPIGTIIGTSEDYLPLTGIFGEVIRYLNPEEGVVDIDAPEELDEFVVLASEQAEMPGQDLPGAARGWDPWWGWLDDAWDILDWWNRQPTGHTLDPAPTLEIEPTQTPIAMEDVAIAPTPGVYTAGETPASCLPGATRFSAAKARSVLLKRAAYAIGQCSLKYSSFKWLVVHTGLANVQRTLNLSERQINFLLLNPVRRRGRGITAANIRTVNRTMSKLESLNRRLNCACGTKRTYKRKKTSCR